MNPRPISRIAPMGILPLPAAQLEMPRKFFHRNAIAPFTRRVIGLENHIEDPRRDHDADERFHPGVMAAGNGTHQQGENHRVNQALRILAVVDRAHARYQPQQKRQHRVHGLIGHRARS